MEYDVKNKRMLIEYQKLISKIKTMLVEESDNSIQNLIGTLNWYDTVYRTFNHGVYLQVKKNNINKLPGTIIDHINRSHLTLILSILRKLFEPPYKKGKHSVNSIPSILKIIKDNAGYWTRENFVCYDGTPYSIDYSYAHEIIYKIKTRHDQFDKITVNKKSRQRNDKLSPIIIDSLFENAKFHDDLVKFTNNFLLHAAVSTKRPCENTTYKKTNLLKAQNQMKKAVWLTLQIGKLVDQLVLTNVAVPQFDPLQAWDTTIFNKSIIKKLETYWDKRVNLWSKWTDKYWFSDSIFISPKKIYDKTI